MNTTSKFRLIVLGIFSFFIVVGVLIFALARGGTGEVAHIKIWGTIRQSEFISFLKASGLDQDKSVSITYVEKDKNNFDQDFIEALAGGVGPDIFFLPQESILKHRDKIFTIPYANYSERTFKDSFIEEGELYLSAKGIIGLPFIIDPMVMFWNRDLFSNAALSKPPSFWSELYDLTTKLTKKDTSLNIRQSALALGEFGNVSNANELLSILIMQAGNPITMREGNKVISVLGEKLDSPILPADSALTFYTEFSNPLKPFYSWNRSLPLSYNYFLAGNLAVYFGFASELFTIQSKNPNLNFDVAPLPQSRESGKVITYGKMQALAITKSSKNIAGAFKAASMLTSQNAISALNRVINLPPVRRDLLATVPSSDYQAVFYDSAIRSRGWLSPDKSDTNKIFQNMIESVTSGRSRTGEAVQRAGSEIRALIDRKEL